MHRQDRFRFFSNLFFNLFNVNLVSRKITIDKNRNCTCISYTPCRGNEGISHRDHLVARTNVVRFQGPQQGIATRSHAHAFLRATEDREVLLESPQLLTHDEHAALHDGLYSRHDLTAQIAELDREVDKRDVHVSPARRSLHRLRIFVEDYQNPAGIKAWSS